MQVQDEVEMFELIGKYPELLRKQGLNAQFKRMIFFRKV